MSISEAPFHTAIADGPAGGYARWLQAVDGVQIRVGVWPKDGAKGTVFLLPGRTEYIEKYGRAATDLAARGYATLSVDWRGQGLADRALDDPIVGHVTDFAEYQCDMDAVLAFARAESLPQPWFLMAHSMGGCIGLRSLMRPHPFRAAAFSAPMWGILIAAWMRPMAIAMASASKLLRFDHRYVPGTQETTYVLASPFVGNTLTTDPEMWDYMRQQALACPALALGGPSLGWLQAALAECSALARMASPDLAVLTALGLQERIVDVGPIHARMARWPKGKLSLYPGAEHEVMMERPATRARFFDEASALYDLHL
jgi:lysophospholipase